MSKFDVVAGIIFHGASYLNQKEKNKYVDRIMELVEERDEERRKPSYEDRHLHPEYKEKDFRDDNVVDRTYIKLLQLGETLTASQNGGKNIRDLLKA